MQNPPYLPLDPKDSFDLKWCAGSGLDALIDLFNKSFDVLRSKGVLIVSYSSVTGIGELERLSKGLGFVELYRIFRKTPVDTIYASLYIKG